MRWKQPLSLVLVLGVVSLAGAGSAAAAVRVVFVNGGGINGDADADVRFAFALGTTTDCRTSNLDAVLTNDSAAAYPITLVRAVTWTFPAGSCTTAPVAGVGGGATTVDCKPGGNAGDLNVTGSSDAATDTTPLTLEVPCTLTTAGGCRTTVGGSLSALYSNTSQVLDVLSAARTLSVTATNCAALFPMGAAVTFSLVVGWDALYVWPIDLRMLTA